MSRLTLTAPNHEKPQNKKGSYFRNYLIQRAENGTQTRDPQLGRLVLYRLSYFRMISLKSSAKIMKRAIICKFIEKNSKFLQNMVIFVVSMCIL